MKVELYDVTKEQNKMLTSQDVPVCEPEKRNEKSDHSINLGSPIPKHRRQQQLQENVPATRGGMKEFFIE